MSLKPRQRPSKRAVIDMRALMEQCADIHAAAECLRFLDEQEGGYTVLPHAEHPEAESVWTMMPLSPKPVRPPVAHPQKLCLDMPFKSHVSMPALTLRLCWTCFVVAHDSFYLSQSR